MAWVGGGKNNSDSIKSFTIVLFRFRRNNVKNACFSCFEFIMFLFFDVVRLCDSSDNLCSMG